MKHGQKADARPQMSPIGSDREQGLGNGAEQESIEQALILPAQRSEGLGNGEHHMTIRHGEQLLRPFRQPAIPRGRLALGVTAIATGNGELSITCRNRHCPKCQTGARNRWRAERSKELLPIRYVQVVFTLPHQLAPLTYQNKRLLYRLLLQASAATLLEVAPLPNTSAHTSAFSACSTPGDRTCSRTLTHDAWHYHLLPFQRITAADFLDSPRVALVCLSEEAAR